jgi:pyrroline-5-carboxylate reductase
MAEGKTIGFIGAGQMAEALARGFINAGITQPGDIRATDPMEVRKEVFRSFGAVAVNSNAEVSPSLTLNFPSAFYLIPQN